jgi:hypothetical protein
VNPPRLGSLLSRLPPRFQWTLHNIVAHPLSEIAWQLGLHRASDAIHDTTVPPHAPSTGRG